jgi:hypothetical protein
MQYIEKITKEQLYSHLDDIRHTQINHVWLGYANVLFLECGKLRQEVINGKKRKNPTGEITFMLESGWRIETTRSIFCGRHYNEKAMKSRIKKLLGLKIQDISLVSKLPELLIGLENKWQIQTFTDHYKYPDWFIGINNLQKVAVHPEWKKEDVSVWFSFEKGHYQRSFCFDDEAFRNKDFLNEYCGQK